MRTHKHYIKEVVGLDPRLGEIDEAIEARVPQNGFIDRSTSTVTFDNGTRTMTITPIGSYTIWACAEEFIIDVPYSIQIDDTDGLHYIYFKNNEDGTVILVDDSTFDFQTIIADNAFVTAVNWSVDDQEANILADERHLRMDAETHAYIHEVFGTAFIDGLGLADMDVDGSGNDASAAQFSVIDGEIRDEDIQFFIVDDDPQDISPIAQIPILYRDGASGNWRTFAATDYPIHPTGTGRASWNEWTGAVWQVSEVGNNDFVLVHYIATTDLRHPIMGVMGQAEYNTISQSRDGAVTEIQNLALGQLEILSPEFTAIATVIYQTADSYSNAVKSRVRSTGLAGEDYVDWRFTGVGSGSGGTAAGSHADLTDRDAPDSHPQSAITDLETDLTTITGDISTNTTNIATNTSDISNKLDVTGKAADSHKLDGYDVAWDYTPGQTVAGRNSLGDIKARLFRSNYGSQNTPDADSHICFRYESASDNYIRFATRATTVTWLSNFTGGLAKNNGDTFTNTNYFDGDIYLRNGKDMFITNDGGYIRCGAEKKYALHATGHYVYLGANSVARCYMHSGTETTSHAVSKVEAWDSTYGWEGVEMENDDSNYQGWFRPTADNSVYLGTSTRRWVRVYAVNTAISSSDMRLKDELSYQDADWIYDLRPVRFRWKDGTGGIKYGLFAQEALQVVPEGCDVVDVPEDPNEPLGISYEQLIAPMIDCIQRQKEMIEELKERVRRLEDV